MKLFITASFKGEENKEEVEKLCSIVKNSGFEDFCFIRDVEGYQKIFSDPKKLMLRSREEIFKSDALLVDLTGKATGRAFEAGMAYALNKELSLLQRKAPF